MKLKILTPVNSAKRALKLQIGTSRSRIGRGREGTMIFNKVADFGGMQIYIMLLVMDLHKKCFKIFLFLFFFYFNIVNC